MLNGGSSSISKTSSGNSARKESVKSYCEKILKQPGQYRRISDVWKELGLDTLLTSNVCHGDPRIVKLVNDKYPTDNNPENKGPKQTRCLQPESCSYFDKDEEDAMCEAVSGMARLGYPLNKGHLCNLCNAYLEAEEPGCIVNEHGGISEATIKRIYKNDGIEAKTNVNPIDPKRAAQSDPQVLNCFYHQLDAAIQMAHEVNPTVWPESRYADVPPSCIYNTDEQGPNPTKLRNPVLIPSDMIDRSNRLFQNTREGDGKMQMHYSVANIVRADGVQCQPHDIVEGTPPPMVLISDPSSENQIDRMEKPDRDRFLLNQSESEPILSNLIRLY